MSASAQQYSEIVLNSMAGDDPIKLHGEIVVGRGSMCDVIIKKNRLSRQHAKLTVGYDNLMVEDLGSTNGTFINNVKINKATLAKHDDVIRFDKLAYQVCIISARDSYEPSRNSRDDFEAPRRAREDFESPRNARDDFEAPRRARDDFESPRNARDGFESPDNVRDDDFGSPRSERDDFASPPRRVQSARSKAVSEAESMDAKTQQASVPPQSWALNDKQSVDGTQLMSLDMIKQQAQSSGASMEAGIYAERIESNYPILVGMSGYTKGKVFKFHTRDEPTRWEIGRNERCDIHVDDNSVSNTHAQLIHEGQRWKLIDLMSANGTYVNGVKSLTSYLSSGDTLRFGQMEFAFKLNNEDEQMYSSSSLFDGGSAFPSKTRTWIVGLATCIATVAVLYFFNK